MAVANGSTRDSFWGMLRPRGTLSLEESGKEKAEEGRGGEGEVVCHFIEKKASTQLAAPPTDGGRRRSKGPATVKNLGDPTAEMPVRISRSGHLEHPEPYRNESYQKDRNGFDGSKEAAT